MDTEQAFRVAMARDPDDVTSYLVFADWLQEHNDPRAEGYRALGVLGKAPTYKPHGLVGGERGNPVGSWEWWDGESTTYNYGRVNVRHWHAYRLPQDWFGLIRSEYVYPAHRILSKDFTSRADADEAAVRAFLSLPEGRRAELLAFAVSNE